MFFFARFLGRGTRIIRTYSTLIFIIEVLSFTDIPWLPAYSSICLCRLFQQDYKRDFNTPR